MGNRYLGKGEAKEPICPTYTRDIQQLRDNSHESLRLHLRMMPLMSRREPGGEMAKRLGSVGA